MVRKRNMLHLPVRTAQVEARPALAGRAPVCKRLYFSWFETAVNVLVNLVPRRRSGRGKLGVGEAQCIEHHRSKLRVADSSVYRGKPKQIFGMPPQAPLLWTS